MEKHEIFVDWSGPYTYEEIINNIDKVGYRVKPSNKGGLYQIYGTHPVYGDNVLVYIGKTDQEFSNRLKGRNVIVGNSDTNNVHIYLGVIHYDDDKEKRDVSTDIARAESLLIHYHKPSNNSSNINSLKYWDEDITVINIGQYRKLHCVISTRGFTKEYEIFKRIKNIAIELGLDIEELYDDVDGYGFWLGDIWFGVDYSLWNNDTLLVLESEKKELLNEPEKKDEEYWFEKINGSNEKIIDMLKRLKV